MHALAQVGNPLSTIALTCGTLISKRKLPHLLVEGNLLQEAQGLLCEVGLLGTNGHRASQLQIVDKAAAEGPPGVKQPLQAPASGIA